MRRPKFVKQFFETDTEHTYLDEKFHGVMIEKNLRNKIYWDNAKNLLGRPTELNEKYIVTEVERLMQLHEKQSKYAEVDLQYILGRIK